MLFILFCGSIIYADLYEIYIYHPDSLVYNWLRQSDIEPSIFEPDYKLGIIGDEEIINEIKTLGYHYEIGSSQQDWIRDIPGYRDYGELTSELETLTAAYPEITSLFSLGPSVCNSYYQTGYGNYQNYQHEVWCLKVSDNPEINEDEPNIYFAAAIHAREPISLEVNMYILNHLLANYNSDEDIAFWIDNTQIWFIPLMNPDGHKMVIDGTFTDHRKNLRDNNGNGLPNTNHIDGVDLNRNYGYVWGNNNASSTPSSSTYHGPYAWSELETIYARDLIYSHKFMGGVTYHSSGQWVLYPLGHLPNVCSLDHQVMGDLAVQMANTIPKRSSDGSQTGYYTPAQAVDFGYTCQGTMGDWGYAEQRIFSFTIELAWTFIPPSNYVNLICEDNLEAALIFLDRVHHSTVTGRISDAAGDPLLAEIYVEEVDFASGMTPVEPVRSDTTFGRYYRPLLPGSYTFTFCCEGYPDQTFENVLVTAEEISILDVVFGTNYVEDVQIELTSSQVTLHWTPEQGFNYIVYSSSEPGGVFSPDLTGEFLEASTWVCPMLADKKFYRVEKISE
ncbi:MAG: hypothetical protein JW784_03810 [Candidatus Cloacimonetes bacterium]|nr:hypothetical protein [Candidatus Cloacimonadota bacterium]